MKQMESADIIKLLQFIYENYERDSFKPNNELLLAMVRKDGMLLGAIMQMDFANDDISKSLEGEAIAQNPLAMIFVDKNNFDAIVAYKSFISLWSNDGLPLFIYHVFLESA
jgi:hypothetical protein